MKTRTRGPRRSQTAANESHHDTATLADPNLEQLREEFDYTLNERDSSLFTRARLNRETRDCVWAGQSADGRKWTPRAGEDQVFPWPGASDARVPLVDKYIIKHVALLLRLDSMMRVKVNATEVNDEAWANRMTAFLRWMKTTQMTERRAENELLANYVLERGLGVMSTVWCKKRQLAYETVDKEDLLTQAALQLQSGNERFADLPGMLLDAAFETEAAELLAQLYPDVPAGRLAKVVAEVRATGSARFPRPAVTMNRPRVIARCPNEDIFISPDASSMEEASAFEVEVMREAKFRSYALDYGWDKAWTEEVLETQQGNVDFGGLQFNLRLNSQVRRITPNRGSGDSRKLFLVVHAYRRLTDAEGVPGIFYTVFHPNLSASAGKHELLNYDHGQLPHTLFVRERRSRRPDDSRGYGEIATTFQAQVKSEWDSRIDRSSIATLPPSYHPPGQAPDRWGPGVQVPTMSPTGYGFMDTPKYDRGSQDVEESVRLFSDDYFGFAREEADLVDAQTLKQKLADDWMEGHTRVDTQILQLCQQFMPDTFYYRVVGSAQGKPIQSSREEIQGQFDISIGYAIENLDLEMKKQKLELMNTAVAMDTNGNTDRDEAMIVAFEMIDPNLGERLVKPKEHATLAEIEDEQRVFVQLMSGVPAVVKPGQAYQLRLQVLTDTFKQNAEAQAKYRENPQAREAFDQRVKDLQQAFQNQPGGPNAVIGRGGPAFRPKLLAEA